MEKWLQGKLELLDVGAAGKAKVVLHVTEALTETTGQLDDGLMCLGKSRLWNNMLAHVQHSYQTPFIVALQIRL